MDIEVSDPRLYLWRYVWHALAAYGACDAWGSAEQLRITGEWVAAGCPVGIAEWIMSHIGPK